MCVVSRTYPSCGIPINDLDTSCALNLCCNFQRTDLLDSLHHSPFTTYTTVSYMLSNTHMVDRFLDKEEIKTDDMFSDVCEIQQVSHSFLPRLEPDWEIDIQKKPLIDRRLSFPRRYSVDGTILRSHPMERSPFPKLAIYQLVSKIYITKWTDGLVWIKPA